MKHVAALFATCLSFWSHESFAETTVPNITGMPYNTARNLLISAGWQPAATVSPNTPLLGTANDFRNIGYSEIYDCEGSGVAACQFYFKDINSKILKIVTVNESEPTKGNFPNVDSYSFEKSLPDSDAQDSSAPAPDIKVASKPPTKEETLLGLSLLECGATTSTISNNLSDTQKGSREALNTFSKIAIDSAKKYLGTSYVDTFYGVYLDNSKDELKVAYANGPSDGQKYSNMKMQSCMDTYTKNKTRIDAFNSVAQNYAPDLMPPESRADAIAKSGVKYQALVSCELSGRNINVYGCFTSTNLKVKTAQGTQLYQAQDLARAGTMYKDGLLINLPEHFELTAQNSQKTLILGIMIKSIDGKKVFEDKAGQYDFISVKN